MKTSSWYAAAFAIAAFTAACGGETHGSLAINLETGEQRRFDDSDELPEGWAECSPEDLCPPLIDCEMIPSDACVIRPDCVGKESVPVDDACADPESCESEPVFECGELPSCEERLHCMLECPKGETHPVDPLGCVDTCTCVPESGEQLPGPGGVDCADKLQCQLQCEVGFAHPIGEDGCLDTCVCVEAGPIVSEEQ